MDIALVALKKNLKTFKISAQKLCWALDAEGLRKCEFPPSSDEAPWIMLNFPNRNRVFDPTRRAVRFWGHDSSMEWSFFVSEDALRRLQPAMARDEASLLLAFDNNRAAIYAAATKAFNRERKGSYELAATDF